MSGAQKDGSIKKVLNNLLQILYLCLGLNHWILVLTFKIFIFIRYWHSSHNELQPFKLPEPVLFGADVLLLELLGRVKEKEDNLFYIWYISQTYTYHLYFSYLLGIDTHIYVYPERDETLIYYIVYQKVNVNSTLLMHEMLHPLYAWNVGTEEFRTWWYVWCRDCCQLPAKEAASGHQREGVILIYPFFINLCSARVLQGESLETLNEGVGYILNRWPALRGAVDYQQGGKNSHLKAEKLIDEIRPWFIKSNGKNHLIPVYNSNFVLFWFYSSFLPRATSYRWLENPNLWRHGCSFRSRDLWRRCMLFSF